MDDGREDSPMPDRPPVDTAAAAVSVPVPSSIRHPLATTVTASSVSSNSNSNNNNNSVHNNNNNNNGNGDNGGNGVEVAQPALTDSASSGGAVNGNGDSSAAHLANGTHESWTSPNSSSASSPSSEEQKEPVPRPNSGWFAIPEDHSVADPSETARIEAAGETSALDEAHWRKKFTDLTDPEYSVDAQGRIDWIVSPFNGTKKDPQYDHLLCSQYVFISGYYWRLKIFPKGIEGPYLAASIECKPPDQINQPDSTHKPCDSVAVPLEQANQHPSHSSSLSWRIPAQFELVIFNPDEPRVHFSKGSAQSFNSRYPSCSFKRFSPVNIGDLGLRLPGQRRALLRDDKLAMVAYIRTYRDQTGCLFLRQTDYWDSFSISGLRGVYPTTHRPRNGQSLLAALVSWLHLPPIRTIVSAIKAAAEAAPRTQSYAGRFACSMHFLSNFVRWKTPGSGTNAQLEILQKALDWHGAVLGEWVDVFEMFELFRDILLKEATYLQMESVMKEIVLLGPMHLNLCYGSNKSVKDVQGLLPLSQLKNCEDDAIKALFTDVWAKEPRLLHLQLPRQRFDEEKRKWKKSRRAYELNEDIRLSNANYKLHAIITHEDMDLRTRSFSTIVRADGINFYKYGPDYQRVVRLTKRQALVDPRENAYGLVYVRQDPDMFWPPCEFDTRPPRVEAIPDGIVPPGMARTSKTSVGITFVDSRDFIGSQHPGIVDFNHLPSGRTYQTAFNGVNDSEIASQELQKFLAREEGNKICFVSELDMFSSRFKPEFIENDLNPRASQLSSLVRWPVFFVHVADREILEQTRSKPNKPLNGSPEDKSHGHMLTGALSDPSESTRSLATNELPSSSTEDTEMVDAEEDGEVSDNNMDGNVFGFDREQLVFVKYFDAIAQTMTGVSCFVTSPEKNVRTAVLQSLPVHISKDRQFKLYEELRITFETGVEAVVRSINDSYCLFKDEAEEVECTIIVEPVLSQEEKDAVVRDGGIADAGKFLHFLYSKECGYNSRATQGEGKQQNSRKRFDGGECEWLTVLDGYTVAIKDYYGSPYFKGQMSRGYPHGQGREITVGGEVYTGGFQMGLRSGQGHLTLQNNNIYQGDFADGKPHGTGKHVDSMTGNIYTGGFSQGKKRGRGTTEWQQAEEEAKVCRVCYDKEQDCAFYPCGHVCACYDCAKQAGTCPMCHRDGSRAFKLFFAS